MEIQCKPIADDASYTYLASPRTSYIIIILQLWKEHPKKAAIEDANYYAIPMGTTPTAVLQHNKPHLLQNLCRDQVSLLHSQYAFSAGNLSQ